MHIRLKKNTKETTLGTKYCFENISYFLYTTAITNMDGVNINIYILSGILVISLNENVQMDN